MWTALWASSSDKFFDGTNNYIKSGTTFRQAINKLNEIECNSSKEHHVFNAIYEDILHGLAAANFTPQVEVTMEYEFKLKSPMGTSDKAQKFLQNILMI